MFFSLTPAVGDLGTVCCCYLNQSDCKAKVDLGEFDMVYTVMVQAFICECILNSLNWVFTMK